MVKPGILSILLFCCSAMMQQDALAQTSEILNTMKSSTMFMMDSVSNQGGFVWNYLPDRSRLWGEMEANDTTFHLYTIPTSFPFHTTTTR